MLGEIPGFEKERGFSGPFWETPPVFSRGRGVLPTTPGEEMCGTREVVVHNGSFFGGREIRWGPIVFATTEGSSRQRRDLNSAGWRAGENTE